MVITEAEAEWYLEQAVAKFAAGVEAVITAPVDENEFAALVSLAYNIGMTGFRKSSALRHFNAGDKAKAAAAIKLWNKAGGRCWQALCAAVRPKSPYSGRQFPLCQRKRHRAAQAPHRAARCNLASRRVPQPLAVL